MTKPLIYNVYICVTISIFTLLSLGLICQTEDALGGGESNPTTQSPPIQPLTLTLRDALTAAVDSNPDVLLYRERIEAARGQVHTQLGALLPTLSATARQTRQTQFRGTFGLDPVRSDPFSIFDARVSASQNLFSVSLIQR
ncbi:MAG: TolC family protein, partial [Nitrospirales bacterium]